MIDFFLLKFHSDGPCELIIGFSLGDPRVILVITEVVLFFFELIIIDELLFFTFKWLNLKKFSLEHNENFIPEEKK